MSHVEIGNFHLQTLPRGHAKPNLNVTKDTVKVRGLIFFFVAPFPYKAGKNRFKTNIMLQEKGGHL